MIRFVCALLGLLWSSAALAQSTPLNTTTFPNYIVTSPVATTPLSGSEMIPIIQNGLTKRLPSNTFMGGIKGPGASTIGDLACWDNTVGSVINDCGPVLGMATAATNAVLTATSTATYPKGIWRLGVNAFGDVLNPLLFLPQSGSCAANSLSEDVGYCNPSSDGNSWLAKNGGVFEVDQFGLVADAGRSPGITFTSGTNAVNGITFPTASFGKPFVCYGCGTNGAIVTGTIVDATHISGTFGKTISSYSAQQAFLDYSNSTTASQITAGDHLTLSDSRATCSVPPVFNVDWVSGQTASLSVFTAGNCSVLASDPVSFSTSGGGAPIKLRVRWGGHLFLNTAISNSGGSGYTNGDLLGVNALTCSVQPVLQAAVTAGAITSVTVLTKGECTIVSAPPETTSCGVALTGGTGTGATACVNFNNSGSIAWGTDNKATAQKVATALIKAKGGTISFRPGASYGINTSNPVQTGTTFVFNMVAPAGMRGGIAIRGNGAEIMDAADWNSKFGQYLFNFDATGTPLDQIEMRNLAYFSTSPTGIDIGAVVLQAEGEISNLTATGMTSFNAQALFNLSQPPSAGMGRFRAVRLSGRAYNTEYGYDAQNNIDLSEVQLSCFECGRTIISFGSGNQTVHVLTQNQHTNTYLVANYNSPEPFTQTNVDINILPAVGGDVLPTNLISLTPAHGIGGGGSVGGAVRNVNLNIMYDGRGDLNNKKLLTCSKEGQVNAQTTWENIHVTVDAFNIQHSASPANLISCPDPGDPSWSNETFRNFVFDRVSVSGDSSATLASDLGGFTAAAPMTIVAATTSGPWNFTNKTDQNLVGLGANAGGAQITVRQIDLPTPMVTTNAALTALGTASYSSGVWRTGITVKGDSRPLLFLPLTGTCAGNGLANDIGSCNDSTSGDGNSWKAQNNHLFEVEDFGIPGDAANGIGVTSTSGSTTIGGITFPASMVGKPFVGYGMGSNGATLATTIASTTTLTAAPQVTISNYKAIGARILTSTSNTVAGDHLTVTGGTCSVPPVLNVEWVDGPDLNVSVFTAGSCTVLPASPVTMTSSGAGTNITAEINWGNGTNYLSQILQNAGGSGYSTSDNLGLTGETCSVQPVVQPTTVDGSGAITGLKIVTPGVCSATTDYAIAVVLTGGSGAGATADPRFLPAGYYVYGTEANNTLPKVTTALTAAGGGTIEFPIGKKYAIDITNPTAATATTPVMTIGGTTSGAWFKFNKSSLVEAHHYKATEGSSPFTITNSGGGVHIYDYGIIQAEPNQWQASGPTGIAPSGLSTSTPNDIEIVNPRCTWGRAIVGIDGPDLGQALLRRVTITNASGYNCEYGIFITNDGNDSTVENETCFGCGRSLYIYGISNVHVSLTSQNSVVNDVLMWSGFSSNNPLKNVHINYRVRPRLQSGYANEKTAGPNVYFGIASDNQTVEDLNIHVDMDRRGDTVAERTAIFCTKLGQVNAHSTWNGLHISGAITNVQNLAGKLINCPSDTDTNWSNETFNNVTFDKLTTTGSATPTEQSDLGGFTTQPMTIRDTNVAGAWTFANQNASNLLRANTTIAGSRAGNAGEVITANGNATPPTAAVTFTAATPTVITGIGSSSGYSTSQTTPVSFTTTVSLPTGILPGSATPTPTTYWVVPSTVLANSVEISDTAAHALAGTNLVGATSTGSGVQTANNTAGMKNNITLNTGAINLSIGKWSCASQQSVAPDTTTTASLYLWSLSTTDSTASAGLSRVTSQLSYAAGKAQILPSASEVFTLDTPSIVYGVLLPTFATSWLNAKNLQIQCTRLQ